MFYLLITYELTVLEIDNTNVNIGDNHSVHSLLKDELPNLLCLLIKSTVVENFSVKSNNF